MHKQELILWLLKSVPIEGNPIDSMAENKSYVLRIKGYKILLECFLCGQQWKHGWNHGSRSPNKEEQMKHLSSLFFAVILLTACQATATHQLTPTPVESLAASEDDLVGVWWFAQGSMFVELKADGTYRVWDIYSGTQAVGEFTFDAGKVTWVTSQPTCNDRPASYEVYVTKEDGKVIQIRTKVVGTDPCSARTDNLKGVGRLYNP